MAGETLASLKCRPSTTISELPGRIRIKSLYTGGAAAEYIQTCGAQDSQLGNSGFCADWPDTCLHLSYTS